MIDLQRASAADETLDVALAAERARLVRLCGRLIGNPDAAEDLAQETLLEAWRSLAKLRTPDGLAPWLNAIAHNVCLRWARSQGRELARRGTPSFAETSDGSAAPLDLDDVAADNAEDEVALALERDELAELLDRALALLPAEARTLLVESYINERAPAEMAARLGLGDGALRVRLHRGRLALRRVLTHELREEAVAFGIALPETSEWQEARIWCPVCGTHRLRTRIDRAAGDYAFHCPSCGDSGKIVGSSHLPNVLAGLSSVKSLLTRHCLYLDVVYRRALFTGRETCPTCGGPMRVSLLRPEARSQAWPFAYGLHLRCPACASEDYASSMHLALDTVAAQRFWRRYPRMRLLPAREVALEGRAALATGFESVDQHGRLDLVLARDTYEVLRVEGEAGA